MQPLVVIGEDAPDRSLSWGVSRGKRGFWLDSVPGRRGSKSNKVPLCPARRFAVSFPCGFDQFLLTLLPGGEGQETTGFGQCRPKKRLQRKSCCESESKIIETYRFIILMANRIETRTMQVCLSELSFNPRE